MYFLDNISQQNVDKNTTRAVKSHDTFFVVWCFTKELATQIFFKKGQIFFVCRW